MSSQTTLYCWVFQVLHETSFHINNINCISNRSRLQSYSETICFKHGMNQMRILKNPKICKHTYTLRLFHLSIVSKQYSQFSTNSQIKLVMFSFTKKNCQFSYKYLVFGRENSTVLCETSLSSKQMFSETDIIKMLYILNDNISVSLDECVFSTNNRHSRKYLLCSSSRRLYIHTVVGLFHTGVL